VPASHSQPKDLTLLCAYARAAALERRAAEESQISAVGSLSTLTVRLRLGPRSRDPNHQRTAKVKASQSYYDQIGGQR
jgi:hypothetical protein